MKRIVLGSAVVVCFLLAAGAALATNGTNLIGVGAITRSMGGVGIAAPQDAIGAVFANPAAMCFGPYCPGSEFDFAGTLFMPKVDAKITLQTPVGPSVSDADSDNKVYAIPAIGISSPITKELRFGLAAYGVSGLGVDYRDTGLNIGGQDAEVYTQLQIMKFSPAIAYQPSQRVSLGIGLQVDYSSLDLGQGASFNYGIGAQLGAIFMVTDGRYIGVTYLTPQNVKHENVSDFMTGGEKRDLELESPQQIGLGVAFEPIAGKLLLEADAKWVNWADANGYEDFDWDNQWVMGLGVQFKPTSALALRVGYNYGENPLKEHNGFDGSKTNNVQGIDVNRFGYEYLRIIGFPAIVQHHITAGIGYQIARSFSLHLGYVHAFEETIEESGTMPLPNGSL
ncbi:MAG: OmpP1/FadL family transporter, partial [Thermodesulfovibrionales bacterium]